MSVVCRFAREDLVTIVKQNREAHITELAEAREGYRAGALANLDKVREKVIAGERAFAFSVEQGSPWPESHVESYDRAIAMFERSIDETVTLDAQEFAQLVDDHWDWKSEFTRVSNSYKSHA